MDRTAPNQSPRRLLRIAVVAAVASASSAVAATVPGWQPMAPAGGLAPRDAGATVPAASLPPSLTESTGALLKGDKVGDAAYACSGVLVGCGTFLTAAQCVCAFGFSDAQACQQFNPPDPRTFFVFLQHGGVFEVESVAVDPDFSFPNNDVALLHLRRPVDGIAPSPINQGSLPEGTAAAIVGFGDQVTSNFGVLRSLTATTHSCGGSDAQFCWSLDPLPVGADPNLCVGDIGSPLFVSLGGATTVAGATIEGPFSCDPSSNGVDTNLANSSSFISNSAGGDLGETSCGCLPNAGSPDAPIFTAAGALSLSNPEGRHLITVPAGTQRLRITMNGERSFNRADFDLYVRRGSPPTTSLFDCRQNGDGQFAACEFDHPGDGSWYVLVRRVSDDDGSYQLTATLFGGAEANNGHSCDDGNPCTTSDLCGDGTCRGSAQSGIACDDGDVCTKNDSCVFGVCVSDPVTCEGDADQCHDAPTCNSELGCVAPAKPNFTPCDPQGAVACRSQSSFCLDGECAEPSDVDGDKICDLDDNCVSVPNASQLDADHDGVGNVCDDSDVPLRIQSVKLLGRHGDRPNGRMTLKAEFTAISPDAFDPARGLAMRITDSLNLSRVIQWPKGRCTTSPDDITTCKNRDATRTLSIRKLSSTTPGTVTYVVRFRAVGLPLDTPFVPPVHATLVDGPGVFVRGTDRVGTTGNCRSTDAGLTCASPYAPPVQAFVGGTTASLLD